MNIKQLKILIQDLPDNTPILTHAPDHSYRKVRACIATGLNDNGDWTEDHGEEDTPEEDYGVRTQILLIE